MEKIKYQVIFAECDDCIGNIFVVDVEEDKFIEVVDFEYGSCKSYCDKELKEKMENERPSEYSDYYEIYDTLEEAKAEYIQVIDESELCYEDYYKNLNRGEL